MLPIQVAVSWYLIGNIKCEKLKLDTSYTVKEVM